jgi:hypothetical protein
MRVSTITAGLLALPLAVSAVPTTAPPIDNQLSAIVPGIAGKIVSSVEKWWSATSGAVKDKLEEGVIEGMKVETLMMDGTECRFCLFVLSLTGHLR